MHQILHEVFAFDISCLYVVALCTWLKIPPRPEIAMPFLWACDLRQYPPPPLANSLAGQVPGLLLKVRHEDRTLLGP